VAGVLVARAAGLWDSVSRPRVYLSDSMRLASSIFVLIASGLLAAAPAGAATRTESGPMVRSADAPRTLYGHAPRRLGPVAPSMARRAGLGDTSALLRCATGDSDDDDNLVMQDETPAARIDAGDGAAPALEPLGTLAASRDALPTHRILSRRSPRGPPVF